MGDYSRKEVGRIGEDIACEFLVRKGFQIVERNYLRPWGEIDIIALRGVITRFVEVKTFSREMRQGEISRESSGWHPEELVDRRKLQKLVRTASLYMEGREDEYQIDVVAVILDMRTRTARCRLLEQVLDEEI